MRGLQIAALLLLIGITTGLIYVFVTVPAEEIAARFRPYGYLGIFLITLISSASIVLPVPGFLVVALLAGIFHPAAVGAVASVGGTLGELTAYFAGYWGQAIIVRQQAKRYQRALAWMHHYGGPPIFVFSAVPFLLFDLAGIAAGSLRYPLWKFLLYCWLGRLVRSIIEAYLGWGSLKIIPWFS